MTPAADTRPPACGHAQPDRYPQQRDTPTAPGYASVFRGRAEEAARVRREIAAYLENCPAVDDMVLIASEMAVNAVMHTRSRGTTFRVRCQLCPRAARVEVEDLGGPWRQRRSSGDRPHGLDIIQALTGPEGWGTQPDGTGGRITWARLTW